MGKFEFLVEARPDITDLQVGSQDLSEFQNFESPDSLDYNPEHDNINDVIYTIDYEGEGPNTGYHKTANTVDYQILSQVEFLQSFVEEDKELDDENFGFSGAEDFQIGEISDQILTEDMTDTSVEILQDLIQEEVNDVIEEKVRNSGLTTWRYKGPGFVSVENEPITVKENQPIFELHDIYEKYLLSFDMEVHGRGNDKHWRSLLQFSPILNVGVESEDGSSSTGSSYSTSSIDHNMIPFEGYPGLWLHRGTATDLLLIVSCNNKYYRKIRIDTNFKLNEKNNVKIKVYKDRGNGKIKIYLNNRFTGLHYGAKVCAFSDFIEAMNIYAGNPWHDAANATLSNIRYEPFW